MSQENPAAGAKRRAELLIGFLSRWPLPALYRLSDLLFAVLFHIARYQRKLLVENLQRAFPGKPDREIQHLAAANYRNSLDFLFETIKAWRLEKQELARRVTLHNPQAITRLVEKHKTVLALTSHYANWEWLQLACAAGLGQPIAALYRPLSHSGVDSLLTKMRRRFGTTLVEAGQALPQLADFSRHGGIIALNADQLPRPEDEKFWCTFLGLDTAFFTGPARLARLFKAPLVFVRMTRLRRGHYRVDFETLLEPPYTGGDHAIMQAYIGAMEKQIEAAPEGWFWLYKRWKYPRSMYAD